MKKWTKLLITNFSVASVVIGIILFLTLAKNSIWPDPSKDPILINEGINHVASGALKVNYGSDYVAKLGLNKFEKLSTLTSNDLDKKLKAHYPNINLKIEKDSDEQTGTLRLNLSGQDGNTIVAGTSIITGFETYDYQSYNLADIKLNLGQWFDDQMPIIKQENQPIDLSKINSNDNIFNHLIKQTLISLKKANKSETAYVPLKYARKWLNNISPKLTKKSTSKPNFQRQNHIRYLQSASSKNGLSQNNSNQNYQLQLANATIEYKKYDGNNWIKHGQKTLTVDNSYPNEFHIPTFSDLYNYMVDQINVLDDQQYQNYYPSFFQSIYEATKAKGFDFGQLTELTNFQEVVNKYKSYLDQEPQTNLELKIDTSSQLIANDFNGTLNFNLLLSESNSSKANLKQKNHNHIHTKKFPKKLSGMKNINQHISDQTQDYFWNIFKIKNEGSFNFFNNVFIMLKTMQTKIIDFFENDKQVSITLNPNSSMLKSMLSFITSSTGYVFNSKHEDEKWKEIAKNLKSFNDFLYLFNLPLIVNKFNPNTSNSCSLNNLDQKSQPQLTTDLSPSLYYCANPVAEQNHGFYINSLKYQFNETNNNQIEIELSKTYSEKDKIKVHFFGKTIVGFHNPSTTSTTEKEFETKFVLEEFSKNQLIHQN